MKTPNTAAINLGPHPGTVCIIVGLGLLGSAVARKFERFVPCSAVPLELLQLGWDSAETMENQLLHVARDKGAQRLELIWSAGRAGFLSGDEELRAEYNVFKRVVSSLHEQYGDQLTVNLLSSAGGVYEGTGTVRAIEQVDTRRPYGAWKLKQEQLLNDIGCSARIFRLSSVYGALQPRQRSGMLNVLLERALDGGLAEVYASPTTLRDYVFVDDVARYVVDSVMAKRQPSTQILASGRPTSVDGLGKMIHAATGKHVRVQYRKERENTADIVFARSLPPMDFRISPMEETVRLLAARKRGGIEHR